MGEAFIRALFSIIDESYDAQTLAVMMKSARECPDDFLSMHGIDRSVERMFDDAGTYESFDDFRARLLGVTEAFKLLGTSKGIIEALKAVGYASPATYAVAGSAPGWWVGAWPPSPVETARPSWWTGAWPPPAGDTTWWSRFYVEIACDEVFGWDVLTWDSFDWGAPDGSTFGYAWGIDAKMSEVTLVQRIVERWRPAHEVCAGILARLSGSEYFLLDGRPYTTPR